MKIGRWLALAILIGAAPLQSHAVKASNASTPLFVGHKYTMHYAAGQAFLLDFKSETAAQFTYLEGPLKGKQKSITFTAREVGDGVYMLYWQEENKTTVVHVDDFKKMHSYTNITMPDHTFYNFESAITPADGENAVSVTPKQGSVQEEANKKNVVAFYEDGLNKKDFEAARPYLGESYKQHNPGAADGVEGFRGFVAYLKEHIPHSNSEIKQVFADGDFVILHVHKTTGADDRGVAIVDIFRLENGKIVEHWDVTQSVPERTASGNSMF